MDKNNKNKRIALILAGALILAALILLAKCSHGAQMPVKDKQSVIVPEGGVVLTDEPKTSSAERGVEIPGIECLEINADTAQAQLDLYNPVSNRDAYYLSFELILLSSEKPETLYLSPLLAPGESVGGITLSHSLAPGEYDALIKVQPYQMDADRTMTNNAELKIKLTVRRGV